jgi:hypothetical protein
LGALIVVVVVVAFDETVVDGGLMYWPVFGLGLGFGLGPNFFHMWQLGDH